MKLNSKAIISCFCLCIYLLFGILNTGGVGFCLGNEHSKHIGINIFGYESCCKTEKILANNNSLTANHKSPSASNPCNCDDVSVQTSNVSQNILSKPSLDGLFASVKIINTQLIAYYLDFNNTNTNANWSIYRYRAKDDSLAMLNTVILII